MHYLLRKEEILEILEKFDYVTVNYLAEVLCISPSSIRRDLAALESRGLVKRTHGGVSAVNKEEKNLVPFEMRMQKNSIAKRKLCREAAKLINDGDFVYVDSSTTCLYLSEWIKNKKINIITNNLKLADFFKDNKDVSIYTTGGLVLSGGEMVTTGFLAEQACRTIHTDIMIFSAHAVDNCGNITDLHESAVSLRKIAMENTKKKVFLCDASKYDKTSFFHLCHTEELDYFITDEAPGDEMKKNLNPKELIVAK